MIRVAGNIVAPSQIGSVEFAAARFGTRLAVVLGHTQCGAVLATLEELNQPARHESHADEATMPIALTFALVGLYPHVERGLSGRQVQPAHMVLARQKRKWPAFSLPSARGALTAADVIRVPEGRERDEAIHAWCAAVWHVFRDTRPIIVRLLEEYGI